MRAYRHICTKTQLIFLLFTCDSKKIILRVSLFSRCIFHVNSKFILCRCCYSMDFVQSELEFAIQITKTIFVILPTAVEINTSIKTTLKYSPSSVGCCHVTQDFETAFSVQINLINSILFDSFLV